ncbi:hypothetical protein NC653_003339 [Populus alba x Populus x berolinensis]|uniref:Uncharacterized protein n=1 Tax=Populus alba x Populus x berolinensis TaxID=444605 RepID=A0AAD6RS18_9ROSI|nr:hypothetical protein NC653_003339 [Populus alba x Populus x berolinensis]
MRDVIDIRQGTGYQYVSLSRDRELRGRPIEIFHGYSSLAAAAAAVGEDFRERENWILRWRFGVFKSTGESESKIGRRVSAARVS